MLNFQPKLNFDPTDLPTSGEPFKKQLLKWIGNKQKQAPEIVKFFPSHFDNYIEPFLGSGGVLGVLNPRRAIASDTFAPLMEIWQTLQDNKETLKLWYSDRFDLITKLGKIDAYNKVLSDYNRHPNGADFVFLCRACYGGVIRFRKTDGYMSTPCGAHHPVNSINFADRVDVWHQRTINTNFEHADFAVSMRKANNGDLVYCDPPYSDSQAILYGAQSFSLRRLFDEIADCKNRGVSVALSIDGTKYSGGKLCNIVIPAGLFKKQVFISVGRSMLKRFQMDGQSLEAHEVTDRLLLTY